MAQKKKTLEAPEGALVTMAKNIGATAGKVAGALGMAAPEKPTVQKVAKLAKKKQSRVPRRQVKAVRKAARAPKSAAKPQATK